MLLTNDNVVPRHRKSQSREPYRTKGQGHVMRTKADTDKLSTATRTPKNTKETITQFVFARLLVSSLSFWTSFSPTFCGCWCQQSFAYWLKSLIVSRSFLISAPVSTQYILHVVLLTVCVII